MRKNLGLKLQITSMPAIHKQSRLIDTQKQLDELCNGLLDRPIIAMDTEFVRTQTYFAHLCLIQIATDAHLVYVDVLADLDCRPFVELLATGNSMKVIHAAKQDIEALYSTYGQIPGPIFDTQVAAGLLGFQPQIGYATLVEELLGIRLEKGQTRTDWSRRPLTAAQTDYALDDVLYLSEMHSILRKRLETGGRYTWALEDSAALTDSRLYDSPTEDAWQRLPGIAYLPVPVQSRARLLATWRENQARKLDRPRQWILADKVLLRIAEADPEDGSSLRQVSDLPAGVARKQGEALLEVLRQANDDVAQSRIEFRQQVKPPTPDQKALKRLAQIVHSTADELGISADLLATRRDLTALMRGQNDTRQLSGWRRDVIGQRLLAAV